MFITKAEKEDIHKKIAELRNSYDYMIECLNRLMLPAPYGRCKDGTPRKKPGAKKGARK